MNVDGLRGAGENFIQAQSTVVMIEVEEGLSSGRTETLRPVGAKECPDCPALKL